VKLHKVLAVNDDKDFCECCGKSNLKKVVWIENTETGEIRHFGVICVLKPAKGFGVEREVKSAERSWASKLQAIYSMAWKAYKAAGGSVETSEDGRSIYAANRALYDKILKETKSKHEWFLK